MPSLKASRLLLPCMAIVSIACVGCLPYYGLAQNYGLAQKRISREPIAFSDANTGDAIGTVLVIPCYTSSSGVSTGAGHGPGSMSHKVFIAHPFLYHRGQNFNVRQPKTKGVITLPPVAFIGSGITLDGVVAIAPGYKPQWLGELWPEDPKDKTWIPCPNPRPARICKVSTRRWIKTRLAHHSRKSLAMQVPMQSRFA